MGISQSQRLLSFISPLGKETLLVKRFSGEESISHGYVLTLDLLSETQDIDFSKILGKPAVLCATVNDTSQRYWHGIVSCFAQISNEATYYAYRAELRPWLWLLQHTMDSRIFQDKSAPEIIEAVLTARGFSDFKKSLSRQYVSRPYCVQYRESDFDFISRLMEEEGIFYYFEHSQDKHMLVLADANNTLSACLIKSTLPYQDRMHSHENSGVFAWQQTMTMVPAKVTLSDYNFEQPSNHLLVSSLAKATVAKQAALECYEYPGRYTQVNQGETCALLRMQGWESQQTRTDGRSDCCTLIAGYTFTLTGHFRSDYNQIYLLSSVYHEATNNLPWLKCESHYENRFVCQRKTVQFYAARTTPRPAIPGVQTALVVGPSGEEIYTDKYGRVKVQFFWDRIGGKNEQSTCWVRVAQNSAGVNWGSISIPRVGQEVVVDFVDGNPDQPLIIGSVYNAQKMPPYSLPNNKTQTGLKTRSTPNGSAENFNELRFEDKKGNEDIHFQAEKDFHRVVKNNDDLSVGQNQSETIKSNRTIVIEEGNDTLTVKKGDVSIKVSMGKNITEAMQAITLKVGQNSITIDQKGITLKGMTVNMSGDIKASISAPMVEVKSDALLTLKGGLTMIN